MTGHSRQQGRGREAGLKIKMTRAAFYDKINQAGMKQMMNACAALGKSVLDKGKFVSDKETSFQVIRGLYGELYEGLYGGLYEEKSSN